MLPIFGQCDCHITTVPPEKSIIFLLTRRSCFALDIVTGDRVRSCYDESIIIDGTAVATDYSPCAYVIHKTYKFSV